MRRSYLLAIILAVLPGLPSPSFAAGDRPPAGGAAALPRAAVTAIGNARIMTLIAPGSALLRKKGVASVTSISRGLYCLKPSSTSINRAQFSVVVP